MLHPFGRALMRTILKEIKMIRGHETGTSLLKTGKHLLPLAPQSRPPRDET